jgi:hypothetical protein
MRGVFKGTTFKLTAPQSNALRMTLLNEINVPDPIMKIPSEHIPVGLKIPEHVGKLDRHELGPGLTPQVYLVDGSLVAVRCEGSNFNNRVWLMEAYSLKAVPVPSL